jgi:dimethylhistidine N-methyltransferase
MAKFIQIAVQNPTAIRDELAQSLTASVASIAPKHFYDALGSKLFEAICELPEYYPTRTEAAILARHAAEIGDLAQPGTVLVDLGAGNCEKSASLFAALAPQAYVPLDISVDFLKRAVNRLQEQHPHIAMLGVGIDFSRSLELPQAVPEGRRLFFYPGSSIGNFTPAEALDFLGRVRAAAGGDGQLLIGVDLIKDRDLLEAAYDDALGVTAAFNLNVLNNVNASLGSDFHAGAWEHHAVFNVQQSRVEMHLRALDSLAVHWPGGSRRFELGETIHTENSYKYRREEFIALLEQAGFERVRAWTDERNWFMVCHAHARQ